MRICKIYVKNQEVIMEQISDTRDYTDRNFDNRSGRFQQDKEAKRKRIEALRKKYEGVFKKKNVQNSNE